MENSLKRSCVASISTLAFTLTLILTLAFTNSVFAQGQENYQNSSLVGRILHIEGKLLRYMPDEEDWIETDQDTPFGEYDMLYCPDDAKAEIILPNNTLIRIGSDTQVQMVQLNSEVTEVDVASGTVRLYNNSSSTEIKATTPFGDVVMPPDTRCDLYVHETQAELLSLKGSILFLRGDGSERHEVMAGSSAVIATTDRVTASAHSAGREWDAWNRDRDDRWAQRMNGRGRSADHLPESLQGEAYDLERNGRWETVYYEGDYRYFWRPSYVSVGWTPFSCGRWIVWHGEHTWVPYESFGYVTHHYGNWVYARSRWYWAPPVSRFRVRAHLPYFNIGVSWYPGRVAWLSAGINVGWVPLGPYETYYSYRYWGPRSRVRIHNHYYNYDYHRYRHHRHARFIDRDRFYRAKNYHRAGLRKLRRGEKIRRSAHVPGKIRNLYRQAKRDRFASANPKYVKKLSKIENRRKKIHVLKRNHRAGDQRVSKKIYQENIKKFKQGRVNLVNKRKKVVNNHRLTRGKPGTVLERFQRKNRTGKNNRNKIVRPNIKKNRITTAGTDRPGKKIIRKSKTNRTWDLNKPGKAYQPARKKTIKKNRAYLSQVKRPDPSRSRVLKSKKVRTKNKDYRSKTRRVQSENKSYRSKIKKVRTNKSTIAKKNSRKRGRSVYKANRKSSKRNYSNVFSGTRKSSSRKTTTLRSGGRVKRNSFTSGGRSFGSRRSGKSGGRTWGVQRSRRSGR